MNHYLFGRDVSVADIITAHPSCSKQHAVLQFRLTQKDDELGRPASSVRPYLLDLGSVNGTFLNGTGGRPHPNYLYRPQSVTTPAAAAYTISRPPTDASRVPQK